MTIKDTSGQPLVAGDLVEVVSSPPAAFYDGGKLSVEYTYAIRQRGKQGRVSNLLLIGRQLRVDVAFEDCRTVAYRSRDLKVVSEENHGSRG